ncbi:hypothetical protein ACFE04_008490 [Oxalis oulophora]
MALKDIMRHVGQGSTILQASETSWEVDWICSVDASIFSEQQKSAGQPPKIHAPPLVLDEAVLAPMSSSKGGGRGAGAGAVAGGKGKKVAVEAKTPNVEQLRRGVVDMTLNSAAVDDAWSEVCSKKSKPKGGNTAAATTTANPKFPQNSNSQAWSGWTNNNNKNNNNNKTWVAAVGKGNVGRGARVGEVSPPVQNVWNRNAVVSNAPQTGIAVEDDVKSQSEESEMSDTDYDDDDDDDSDASEQSHETRKQNKWFKKFFQSMEGLSLEEINDPVRQWHCPACHNGPGAIDWYKGLLPLTTHAKTKGSKRVKLHRELADLLDEELKRRGTSAVPAGESFGQWKGLAVEEKDYDVIWPPMVMIMNTKLDQDEDEKWTGMGNQELLDYFSSYAAIRSRHSYGPQGHRGMSVLIFETSAKGFLEAERLHKHFEKQGTDRDAWDRRRNYFAPGGIRQLFGYMANKEDLEIFNQHSHGKMRLKYDMRSYQEMVVKQIRKMSEDNQQLMYFKNAVDKEKKHAQALEKSYELVSEKLRKTMEENRIVRQRTKLQHEQTKEEMDYQENFFKDQIQIIHEATDAKEEEFERLQQQVREKMQQSNANPSNTDEYLRRTEDIAKLIQVQKKEMQEFEAERDKLIKLHEEKMAAMKKKHWVEEVELEKSFDADLTVLMEKFKPVKD